MKRSLIWLLVVYLLLAACGGDDDKEGGSSSTGGKQQLTRITADNAAQLQQLDMLGRGTIGAMAWSQDGTTLAVGGGPGIWLYAGENLDAEPRLLAEQHGAIVDLAFSADGALLASANADQTVSLWNVAAGTERAVLEGHTADVTSVAFSPDGSLLASGDEGIYNYEAFHREQGGVIRLWDVASGTERAVLEGHATEVTSVAFSPDGSLLASGEWGLYHGEDSTIRLWDVATGTEQTVLDVESGAVTALAFSPDGASLASAGGDLSTGMIYLWDVATGTEQAALEASFRLISVAFSPDGTRLVGGSDSMAWVWDVATREKLFSMPEYYHSFRDVAFSPDGSTLVSVGGSEGGDNRDDNTIRVWDAATGDQTKVIWHTANVEEVLFSADGSLLIAAYDCGPIRLWDVASRTIRSTLEPNEYYADCIALSPDGTLLVSCEGGSVEHWSLTSGEAPEADFYPDDVDDVTFSPDGSLLVAVFGDRNSPRIWNLAQDAAVVNFGDRDERPSLASAVAFSPDSATFALGTFDGDISLWRVDGWELIAEVDDVHEDSVTSVAFSPDGSLLASGAQDDEDNTVRLLDVATGTEQAVLTAEGTERVVFSPDGSLLAAAGRDSIVTLWDVETATVVAELTIRTDWTTGLAFNPQGTLLATGSDDGTVRLWAVPAAK